MAESHAIDAAVRSYLKSTDGQELLEKHSSPFVLNFLLTVLMIVLGWLLCLTIIGIWFGLKMIWAGLSLRPFRTLNTGSRIRSRLDDVKGMIMPLIIIGPGESHEAKGLALGAFDEVPLGDLAMLAERFGEVYCSRKVAEQDRPLKKLLRNDTYEEGRRRRVPSQYNLGHDLYLFDVAINHDEINTDFGAPLTICAVTGEQKGSVLQLPWTVVDSLLDADLVKTSDSAQSLRNETG